MENSWLIPLARVMDGALRDRIALLGKSTMDQAFVGCSYAGHVVIDIVHSQHVQNIEHIHSSTLVSINP